MTRLTGAHIPLYLASAGRSPGGHAFMLIAQVFCGVVFAVDVTGEAIAAYYDPTRPGEIFHIGIEIVATVMLAVGAFLIGREFLNLRRQAETEHRKLLQLRQEFDQLVNEKFASWGLSKSESDVALLTIRGMSICDIAKSRERSEGTIKSQLSTIFHKAKVGSRTELLALFIDELLDYSSMPRTSP